MEGNTADDDLGDDFNDAADTHLLPTRGKGQARRPGPRIMHFENGAAAARLGGRHAERASVRRWTRTTCWTRIRRRTNPRAPSGGLS